jgi:hypothetical protein
MGVSIELSSSPATKALSSGISGWTMRGAGWLSGLLPLTLRLVSLKSNPRNHAFRRPAAISSLAGSLLAWNLGFMPANCPPPILLSRSGFLVPLPWNEFQVPPRVPLASTLAYLLVEVAQCGIPYSPRISSLVSRRTLPMGRFRRFENSVVTSLWLSTAVSCDCYSVR